MQLGFVTAILPELSLDEVLAFAAAEGFACVEPMCWPVGTAERRFAGVTHVDVTDFSQAKADAVLAACDRHGVALSGLGFYPNPLESRANYKRSPWFGTSCCPVNVVRMVPSVPGYIYATRGDALFVNLFIGGTAKVQLGGQAVTLTQTGDYPWDGKIKLTIAPGRKMNFALKLRIPGWARNEPLSGGLYRYADQQPVFFFKFFNFLFQRCHK